MRPTLVLLPRLFAGCLYTYEDSPSSSREEDAGMGGDDDGEECSGGSGGGGASTGFGGVGASGGGADCAQPFEVSVRAVVTSAEATRRREIDGKGITLRH